MEFLMDLKLLGQGVEVLVTVFGACKATADREWSSIARHPQLEVCIMGNCHESGERWSPRMARYWEGQSTTSNSIFSFLKFIGVPKMTDTSQIYL
jgi:hypothetical protein